MEEHDIWLCLRIHMNLKYVNKEGTKDGLRPH